MCSQSEVVYSLSNSTGITWKRIKNGHDETHSRASESEVLGSGGSNLFFHKSSSGFSWRTPSMIKRLPSLDASEFEFPVVPLW